MGQEVTSEARTFVAFRPRDGDFEAFMSVDGLLSFDADPESLLGEAARIYRELIGKMRTMVAEIESLRVARHLVPARKIWRVGDMIFDLTARLASLSLQIDSLYGHLERDLSVKRKWLEKVVIFRRYVPGEEVIPEGLNWGRCEKGTRRIAERLSQGLPVDHRQGRGWRTRTEQN